MYYPEELVEEVRSKSDIVETVSRYVKLQKKGGSHWGLCPFHNEKTPSFSVSASKQIYHCFGCGAGGDVFGFLMNYENYTFPTERACSFPTFRKGKKGVCGRKEEQGFWRSTRKRRNSSIISFAAL